MNYSTLSKLDKAAIYLQGAVALCTLGSGFLDPSFILFGIIFSTPLSVIVIFYLFGRCVHFWRRRLPEPPYFVIPSRALVRVMVASIIWLVVAWLFLYIGMISSSHMWI